MRKIKVGKTIRIVKSVKIPRLKKRGDNKDCRPFLKTCQMLLLYSVDAYLFAVSAYALELNLAVNKSEQGII